MSYGRSFKRNWNDYPKAFESMWFICPVCRYSFMRTQDVFITNDLIECPYCFFRSEIEDFK